MIFSPVIWRAAACLVVSLFTALTGFAYELGQTVQLTQNLSRNTSDVDLAYNSLDNQYLAVWSISAGGARDVAGQRFTHDGTLVGSNLSLMADLGGQTDPKVAYNPVDNQYLLAARVQNDSLAAFNGAVGRRVAATGDLIGSRFAVSSAGLEPELVYNGIEHEYFFTGRKFQNGVGIFGQRISVNGATIDTATRLDPANDPPNGGSARAPNGDLVWNSVENEYLTVWREQVGELSVETRRIGIDGIPLAMASAIATGTAVHMEVAFDPLENRYLVAYDRRYTASDPDSAIMGMFVDADGMLIGTEMLLSAHATVEQFINAFSLEFDPVHRRYLLVSIRGTTDLVGRSFSASGAPASEFVIAATGETIANSTILFNEANQGFMVAWEAGTDPATRNILARAVSVPEPAMSVVLFFAVIGVAALRIRTNMELPNC
jgi:hypothetical protein